MNKLLHLFTIAFAGIVLLPLAYAAPEEAGSRTLQVAAKENRVALVIGNSAYPGLAGLKNPVNDAKDMAAKLKKLGFDVTLRTDTTQKQMLRAMTEFGGKLSQGSVALFFYAGHGMQVQGRNYLIPVDAEIANESAVSTEAVDADQLLVKLSPARVSMVILDACRNNPFERKFRSGAGGGLAQMNAPAGTLVAYSTSPGKVASDGTGRNGLYTQELLKSLDEPNLKVEDVFKRVRAGVMKKSGDVQTPWESSSLTGDFYFSFSGPATVNVQSTPSDPETEAWRAAEGVGNAVAYEAYLKEYPQGRFGSAARIKLASLKEVPPPGKTLKQGIAEFNEIPNQSTAIVPQDDRVSQPAPFMGDKLELLQSLDSVSALLRTSSAAKHIEASQVPEAQSQRKKALELHVAATAAFNSGNFTKASALIREARSEFFDAVRLAAKLR